MKPMKIILIILVTVLIFSFFSFKNKGRESFTISDELLSYEDEIKKHRINNIDIFYVSKGDKIIRSLTLAYRKDEAAMKKVLEELHGISVEKLNRKEIRKLEKDSHEWGQIITEAHIEGREAYANKSEIVAEMFLLDMSNLMGPVKAEDKITKEIIIYSTGDIVFKMPEEKTKAIPKKVFYKNTDDVSEKIESIIEIIDSAYGRRYPKIES